MLLFILDPIQTWVREGILRKRKHGSNVFNYVALKKNFCWWLYFSFQATGTPADSGRWSAEASRVISMAEEVEISCLSIPFSLPNFQQMAAPEFFSGVGQVLWTPQVEMTAM